MSNLFKQRKDFLFSIIYTITIITICILFNSKFFNTDDSLNEYIGFYKQYGKIWAEGHVPFIVDTLLLGGNGMIELQRGIFLPQAIIASLFAHFVSIKKTGVLIALMNISLIVYSSIKIAKFFNIKNQYAYTFAAFMAIQPTFLYQYSAGWWNAAHGQAWATAAIASFLWLREKQTAARVFIHFIVVIFLLSSGWPHGVIGYAVFAAAMLIFDFTQTKKIHFNLIIPNVLSILFALPIYSEYIASSDLINRPSGYHNHGDFLVPEWSSIIMSFNPTYYDFLHYFGGYRLIPVSLAFSTIFLIAIFCFRKTIKLVETNKYAKFLFALIITYFILTQMPTQFGPLRWPFRFLPFLAFSITLFTFFILDKAEIKNSKFNYYLIITISFILSIFSSLSYEENITKYIILNLLSCILLLSIPFLLDKKIFLLSTPLISLIIMLLGLKSLGHGYIAFNPLKENVVMTQDANLSGFMLSFTDRNPRETINDLSSSQFGAYDIKSINGYSPIGHKNMDKLLPAPTAHGIFHINESLNNILQIDNLSKSCIAPNMGISVINLSKPDFDNFKDKLMGCGYTDIHATTYDDINASLPKEATQSWQLFPLTIVPYSSEHKLIEHSNNYDVVQLAQRNAETTIIFPRVWWHGYTAKFNGNAIPVGKDSTNAFIAIKVPAGESGILELSYFPSTWRKIWWLPLLALILLTYFIAFHIRQKTKA